MPISSILISLPEITFMNLQHSQYFQMLRARMFTKLRSTLESKTVMVFCSNIEDYTPNIKVIFTNLHLLTLYGDKYN